MRKFEIEMGLSATQLNADYVNLGSLRLVAQKYGTSHSTIRNVFKRLGIEFRSKNYKSAPVNHDFFASKSDASYYWAGFITADGCVHKNTLSLNLSKRDLAHLEILKHDLEYGGNIYHTVNKLSLSNPKWRDVEMCRLHIYSDKIVKDLAKFNIVANKTHKTIFPKDQIPSDKMYLFMRGYFDGDGTICLHKPKSRPNRRPQMVFGLRGTKTFLQDFNEVLVRQANLPERCLKKKISVTGNIGQITYNGNGVCSKIKNYLYSETNTPFLKRKWEKFGHTHTIIL